MRQAERAAAKFVSDEKLHVAGARPRPPRLKLHRLFILRNGPSRYSTRISSFGRSSVTRLVKVSWISFVGDRHVGDDHVPALAVSGALAHVQRAAQRHEFGVVLDVGDEIEHVGCGVLHAPLGRKLRHEIIAPRGAPSAAQNPRRHDATSASAGLPKPSRIPWHRRSFRSALNSSGGKKRMTG